VSRLTAADVQRLFDEFIMPGVKNELAAHERRCHRINRFDVDEGHYQLRNDIIAEYDRASSLEKRLEGQVKALCDLLGVTLVLREKTVTPEHYEAVYYEKKTKEQGK
jgi:hypothetical protein